MSGDYRSMRTAQPKRSAVFAVRYIAKALHDPEDEGHECLAFAYWDNKFKRWARPCLGIAIALNVARTAHFQFHTRQDLEWKEI